MIFVVSYPAVEEEVRRVALSDGFQKGQRSVRQGCVPSSAHRGFATKVGQSMHLQLHGFDQRLLANPNPSGRSEIYYPSGTCIWNK